MFAFVVFVTRGLARRQLSCRSLSHPMSDPLASDDDNGDDDEHGVTTQLRSLSHPMSNPLASDDDDDNVY